MAVIRQKVCPNCREPVEPVRQALYGFLNDDQFRAMRAGDYYCRSCPDNGRGKSGLCYWWEHELPVVHDFQI